MIALVGVVAVATTTQANAGKPRVVDAAALEQAMRVHGLDEDATIERLKAEDQAAVVDFHVRNSPLIGYAGSWFDGETLGLKVASQASDDFNLIQELGAEPMAVEWSRQHLDRRAQVV